MNWTEILDAALANHEKPEFSEEIQLPIMPHAITQFSQKANDPDVSVKELAQVIEVDSGLSVELLKHVNSAYVGLRRQAVTVQQAISMLGIKQSKMFLLTRGLQASLKSLDSRGTTSQKPLIDSTEFWNINLERSLFAREIAKLLRADGDVAFAAAMLQDMMLPVLTRNRYDDYQSFVEAQIHTPRSLTDFENEQYGWNHAVAATFIMRDWNFPDDLATCVYYHTQGEKLLDHPQLGKTAVAAVAVSSLLPDQIGESTDGLEKLISLEGQIPGFRLKYIAEDVDKHFQELVGSRADNHIPLLQRCEEIAAVAL